MSPNRTGSTDVSTVEVDSRVSTIVVAAETQRTVRVIARDRHGRTKTYSLIITPKRLLQLS